MSYNQLRLTDGTIVRRCPTDKPLYCSRAGKFYSVHNAVLTDDGWMLHEVKPSFSPVRRKRWRSSNGISGTQYPVMRHFDCMNCHTLMALTWIGPRPEAVSDRDGKAIRYEIDHLNGDRCDCSADNLQYVTPAENRKRAKLLRVLRSIGRDPGASSRRNGKSGLRLEGITIRDPKEMTRAELLEFFNNYDSQNPDTLMDYQMSHHMEC